MKRDRITLVLQLRELDEQNAQGVLRDALLACAAAQSTVDDCVRALQVEQAWFGQLQREGTTADDLQEAAISVDRAAGDVSAATAAAQDALTVVDGARDQLAVATRRREAVERLRDRQRMLARQEAERIDIARASEVSTIQYVLRRAEASR